MTTPKILPMSPGANYLAHREEIDAAVARVLANGWYILGREVEEFEREFADYVGVGHGIGTASGTDAITLALRVLGLGPGDGVATVSHTAVASVAGIALAGAGPVLVDIDPATYTMSPDALERCVRASRDGVADLPRIRAVMPVHLYGHPADMASILDLARRYELRVIEDCAQAHGASLSAAGAESAPGGGARKVGSFGDLAAFSFYPTKNLGALGDGGALLTGDAGLAERARALREYGWRERYVSHFAGMNTRLDELQAAILRVKLRQLDAENDRRRAIARLYDARLAGAAVVRPAERPGCRHVYHQYVVRLAGRDEVRRRLDGEGIPTMIHYPLPVHLQPAYRDPASGRPIGIHIGPGGLPVTERICREIVSLPMHPQLTDGEADRVGAALARQAGPGAPPA